MLELGREGRRCRQAHTSGSSLLTTGSRQIDRAGRNSASKPQRAAVWQRLNGGPWKLVGEFTEIESGKRTKRPQLEAALAACKEHKAKLVVANLD
jgi:DNA invertase Pin-like site-specific DNA recombinase